MKFYVRGIQFFFKNAQVALIKGETLETIAKTLTKVNKMLSLDSLDKTFVAIESELTTLDINLEQNIESFDAIEDPIDHEDEYVDQIVSELQHVEKDKTSHKIHELLSIDKLMPPIPKFSAEEEDFEQLED